MDHPNYAYYNYDDAYSLSPGRSRAGSRVSSTDGLFQNLHIADSPQSTAIDARRPSSSSLEAAPSPAYLSPVPSHSEPYISSSIAEQYQLPTLHQDTFAAQWVEGQSQSEGPPLVRVDSAPGYSENPSTTTTEETMSAVAIGFDPTSFTMSNRSSFTWPSEPVPNQSLLSPAYYGGPPDPTLTPPSTSRSLTSSPPRAAPLSPEDPRDRRTANRQHTQQRHKIRTQQRVQRTGGSPYSQPTHIPDPSAPPPLPVYTTAAATMSMLAASHPGAIAPQYAYTDASQQSMYSYGAAPVASPGYMSSATQGYYGTYAQQPPATTQYGPSGSIPYAGLPHMMSPPVAERVVTPRPKPQCWDHGCNGRQFSTFSNLLRHQREKSGQAAKSVCPNCGAEFTRTTARNGHLAHDKCKQRRTNSIGGSSTTSTNAPTS
ncbi:hypothetical protein MKZ38_008504 [Zalerion maritima]|uniref:Uncharacterized protein n=1 Tax=Zalerion maritima TaxID=339359 RepID=A0AAD5RH35_9PEZI|nr:hypothetical protein MKZ38_008504 [Zalerion maritima]